MPEVYGRYHGRLLRLATLAEGAWRSKLREILAEFDDECRGLSPACRRMLRDELALQIEQEVLQFRDSDKRAVLALALKHLDAGES